MKVLFLVIGFISLTFGIIGIMLPVLPTTPFLLLSAICFAKGSNKVNKWFKSTKLYDDYVRSYLERKGMSKKKKISLLLLLTLLFMIGLYFMKSLHLRLFIIAILLAHYYYFIFKVKTLKEE